MKEGKNPASPEDNDELEPSRKPSSDPKRPIVICTCGGELRKRWRNMQPMPSNRSLRDVMPEPETNAENTRNAWVVVQHPETGDIWTGSKR